MEVQGIQNFVLNFVSILWEAFPFVVLGALIAGILEEMVPQQWITKLIPKQTFLAIGLGGILGLVFPMCECGIVPVMRRLLRKGLPLGTCVSYMLAGPIINLIVISSTVAAFASYGQSLAQEIVFMRVGIGFLVATTTGFIVQILYRKHGNSLLTKLATPPPLSHQRNLSSANPSKSSDDKTKTESTGQLVHPAELRAGEKKNFLDRLGNISETALHDFVDIMVFLTLGAILAASAKEMFSPKEVAEICQTYPTLAIIAMMGLAILLCLCSEADAFVGASFTTLQSSAKLSFLILGPMFDLKLLLMYTRVFRRKLILTIIVSVISQVFIYMFLYHLIFESKKISQDESTPSQIKTDSQDRPLVGSQGDKK